MPDRGKTRQELIAENETLRQQILALTRDRAEHQQTSAELKESVRQRTAEVTRANEELLIFRKFVETSSQGFSMADFDGHITYVNPALCRILGEDRPEDVIGKHLSAYFEPDTSQRVSEGIESILRTAGQWEGELPMLSRQGKLILTWHRTFLIPDEHGKPLCIAVAITDIGERKRAEAALRQNHDELQAIYEGMTDGMHIIDLKTMRAVRANAALCRMMGYSEEEIFTLSQQQVHPPEALPKIVEDFRAHIEGRMTRASEVPLVRKDGSIFYAEISVSRIVYNGSPSVMCFFHDVTHRRQARIRLEQERRTLKHLLQASDHERQVIAYDIHDGLAQQLAAAIMQLEAFKHLNTTRPKEAADAMQTGMTMLRQAHAEARRLISGVRPPILDEEGVVAAIFHLINEQRLESEPTIEFNDKVRFTRLAPILENTIYRIVQESLTNACKHSRSPRVKIGLTQHDDRLRIEVRDWGVGFDANAVYDNRYGLAGMRQRARLLGGRFKIRSKPDEGTSVIVEMPIVERSDVERSGEE